MMAYVKKKILVAEGVGLLNSILGFNTPAPEAPVTRSHRIVDRPVAKANKEPTRQRFTMQEYNRLIMDYVKRHPECGAKEISQALTLPNASVQNFLSMTFKQGKLERRALHNKRGCRPIFIYWISNERPD